MKVLNLDEFTSKEINEIEIESKKYKVPEDIPVKLSLELMSISGDSNLENIGQTIEVLYKIFSICQEVDKEEFMSKLTFKNVPAIVNFIYGMDVEDIKKTMADLQNMDAEEIEKISKKKKYRLKS